MSFCYCYKNLTVLLSVKMELEACQKKLSEPVDGPKNGLFRGDKKKIKFEKIKRIREKLNLYFALCSLYRNLRIFLYLYLIL